MCTGFIQLSKDFFESGYWRQSRTYNDCEAVLDIISQVRFEASEQFARIGGREVTWGQAEWPASVRFLAQRWNWTERRVRTLISSLKRNGIIDVNDSQGVSIIKLKKFLVFSDAKSDTIGDTINDTTSDTPNTIDINALIEQVTQQVTQRLTQERHSGDTKHNNGYIYNNIDSSLHSESLSTDVDASDVDARNVIDFYNKSVEGTKLSKCIKLTKKRKESINARIKDFGIDKVYEAIRKVAASSFCNGNGGRGWKADIDFIFNPNSFVKILEGKYDTCIGTLPIGFNLTNTNANKYDNDLPGW